MKVKASYCPTCGESLFLKKVKKWRAYSGYCMCCKSHIIKSRKAFYVKKSWAHK